MKRLRVHRGLVFGAIIIVALVAFEVFNFSTTEFALHDLLGNMRSLGLRWATVLAVAFCGIDFAGLARLFTPEVGRDEPVEVWYLFGAWLLAATMNAMLTWWGVSVAVISHPLAGKSLLGGSLLLRGVPIFIAVLVWLIRVLIIGTFALTGDRLLHAPAQRARPRRRLVARPLPQTAPRPAAASRSRAVPRPSPRPVSSPPAPEPATEPVYEPLYEPLPMSAHPAGRE